MVNTKQLGYVMFIDQVKVQQDKYRAIHVWPSNSTVVEMLI